jgi:hypothetical protein
MKSHILPLQPNFTIFKLMLRPERKHNSTPNSTLTVNLTFVEYYGSVRRTSLVLLAGHSNLEMILFICQYRHDLNALLFRVTVVFKLIFVNRQARCSCWLRDEPGTVLQYRVCQQLKENMTVRKNWNTFSIFCPSLILHNKVNTLFWGQNEIRSFPHFQLTSALL